MLTDGTLAVDQHVCEVRRRCIASTSPPHCTRCFRYLAMHTCRHECCTAGMRPLSQSGVAAARSRAARRPCRRRCTTLCCAPAGPTGHVEYGDAPPAPPLICLPVCVSMCVRCYVCKRSVQYCSHVSFRSYRLCLCQLMYMPVQSVQLSLG